MARFPEQKVEEKDEQDEEEEEEGDYERSDFRQRSKINGKIRSQKDLRRKDSLGSLVCFSSRSSTNWFPQN